LNWWTQKDFVLESVPNKVSEVIMDNANGKLIDFQCPRISGVYMLMLGDTVVYVGESGHTLFRVAAGHEDKTFGRAVIVPVDPGHRESCEERLIQLFRPLYNKRGMNEVTYRNVNVESVLRLIPEDLRQAGRLEHPNVLLKGGETVSIRKDGESHSLVGISQLPDGFSMRTLCNRVFFFNRSLRCHEGQPSCLECAERKGKERERET